MSEIKRPLKVFLYHAPLDKIPARDLYLRLINDGLDAWLVKERILPSQDWNQEIHNALVEADVILVCLSERFEQGESRQKEVRAAFDSAIQHLDGSIFVIPVRLEECEGLEYLRKWPWVDLFEEAGYERLMHVLQARAEKIGASVQAKESSLPHIPTFSVKHQQPTPEEEPGEARQAILETVEGTSILIDGPVVKLQGTRSPRKYLRALTLILIGLAGGVMAVMFRSPQFQRWSQLATTINLETTQTPVPRTQPSPVVTPTLKPIPTLVGKDHVSHIVFLIDTSGSMQGQRIRMVKSAASKFVAQLSDRYVISVLEFNTNVERQTASPQPPAQVSQTIQSINVDVSHNGSCLWDALYASIQQASFPPIPKDSGTMLILLTDVAPGDHVGWKCGIRLTGDFFNLAWNYRVPMFTIYVGDDFDRNSFIISTAWESIPLAANTEKEVDRTLLAISKAAGLEVNTGLLTIAQAPDASERSMIFVPPGLFSMGSSNTVYMDSFWIDKTEVTNAMYAGCVQAGKCSPPRSSDSHARVSYYGNPEFDHYPVIYVSWLDAQNYCAWVGGRLPTEAEWEKAARGTDGRQFPWGDIDPSSLLGLLNYHSQDTTEVGSYPNGASPYGILDMAGNVSEWVADWLSTDYYEHPSTSNPLGPDAGEYRVWRGGSWANTSTDRVRTDSRTGNFPTDASGGIGFRCARDASP